MWKYWLKQNYQLAKAYIDRARGAPKLHRRFLRNHGYPLNIDDPTTFSEKIQWRKLHDKNPIFPILSNKYLVREYIAERLGSERANNLMVPLLQYATDPAKIDFSALPNQFVLKVTHGSSMNLIVENSAQLDIRAARKQMRKWLMTHYGLRDHEWVYTKTPRGIIVEKLITKIEHLTDVKIFFFDGEMKGFFMEQHDGGFFQTHFNSQKQLLNCGRKDVAKDPNVELPNELNEMIQIGTVLAKGLDFVRVDFLCSTERFYIGELSLLHGSGLNALSPKSYDFELGSFWKLPQLKE